MNIGIDTRHLEMMLGTGGAQVMFHGLRALRRYDTANHYLTYADRMGRWGANHPRWASVASAYADLVYKNVFLPFWVQKRKVDLLLYYLPPCSFSVRGVPQICHILDVPEPEENNHVCDWFYNKHFIGGSASKADHIITISKFSVEQIGRRLGVDTRRISLVYPCIDLDLFKPCQDATETLKNYKLQPGYILGVISKLAPRKNPGAYLEVFRRLPSDLRKRRKLVIVGAPKTVDDFSPYVNASVLQQVREDVVIMGRVPLDYLPRLYTLASVVLFPSRYEGLGLPVLEAAACGTDVIASSIPAIAEVASPAACLFAPDDGDAMAECLLRLWAESSTQRREVHLDWVRKFSYSEYAKAMVAVYAKVL